jgi:hypothetical protein
MPNEPLTIRVGFESSEAIDDVEISISIHDEDGNHIFGTNTKLAGAPTKVRAGNDDMEFRFAEVPLLSGVYRVTLGIQSTDEGTVYDWHEQRYAFAVVDPAGGVGRVALPVTVQFTRSALAS